MNHLSPAFQTCWTAAALLLACASPLAAPAGRDISKYNLGEQRLAFRMTNGQLHLFFNTWYADTRDDWDEDTVKLKKKADENWMKLMDSLAARQ